MCVLGTRICYIHGEIDQKKRAGKQMQAGVYNREQVRLHSSSGYLCCESTRTSLVCGVRVREEHAAGAGCT